MRKTNLWLAIVFAVSSFFVSQIAMAADANMNMNKNMNMSQHSMMNNQQLPGAERVSKLMDKNVKDQAGQTLGKVDDVVVGNQGRISYVILSANNKLYPIPFQALHQGANKDEFVANISKDQLNNAPNFSKNEWPDLTSSQWEQRVFSYYGEQTPQHGAQSFQGERGMQQRSGEFGTSDHSQTQQRTGTGF